MWQGRCARPAHLIVTATKHINGHDEPLSWYCCDNARCMSASQSHAAEHGVIYVDSRLITVADTGQMAVAA
jgi:hypothetical protein